MADLKIVKIRRIVTDRLTYIMAVVDYAYYIDGVGPFDVHGQPKTLPPEDPPWKIKAWERDGRLRTGSFRPKDN